MELISSICFAFIALFAFVAAYCIGGHNGYQEGVKAGKKEIMATRRLQSRQHLNNLQRGKNG